MIERITVLYDAECQFCRRCREWMLHQGRFIEVEFMAKKGSVARSTYPDLDTSGDELLVVDDEGGVYRDSSAFLMCLYALVDYRAWSLRLASPALLPFARQGLEFVSTQRHRISDWLRLRDDQMSMHLYRAVGAGTPRCVGE